MFAVSNGNCVAKKSIASFTQFKAEDPVSPIS